LRAATSLRGGGDGRLRRVGAQDADFFDAARIGIDDLELDAALVAHDLAERGYAPDQREHEAAERIDVLLLTVLEELDAEMRLELLDRRARLRDEALARV